MRRLIVAVALVALVAVGLVAGDEPARGLAERYVAGQLERRYAMTGARVSLDGDPFLLRAAQRELPGATISGDGVALKLSDGDVTLADLDVGFTRLTAGFDSVRADAAAGTARLPLEELSVLADGQPVRYDGDGRLATQASYDMFGQRLEAAVSATLTFDAAAQSMRLAQPRVRITGIDTSLPGGAALEGAIRTRIDETLGRPVPLPSMAGMRVTGLDARADGVHLRLSGQDLVVPLR